MQTPQLTFFCELPEEALQALFADGAVTTALVNLRATVSLGILDLSAGRADVVRRLNRAGVPVIAWQLLPEDEGYWFNLDNAPQATARYAAFKAWSAAHDLQWAGVGIDIEPDIRDVGRLAGGEWRVLGKILRRALDRERFEAARALYKALVEQMQADGYRVDSYHIPLVVDERRAGATLVQRLLGLVDIPTDREILMLYSSFLGRGGYAVLASYGPEAGGIAVGSTGGGVSVGGADAIPPLSWKAFSRDLRAAARWCEDIHIFSLEGCVRAGYLEKLPALDWAEPVTLPASQLRRVTLLRRIAYAALWVSAHPLVGVLALVVLLSGAIALLRRVGRRRT